MKHCLRRLFSPIAPVSLPLSFSPRVPQTHQVDWSPLADHLIRKHHGRWPSLNTETKEGPETLCCDFDLRQTLQMLKNIWSVAPHLFHTSDSVGMALNQSVWQHSVFRCLLQDIHHFQRSMDLLVLLEKLCSSYVGNRMCMMTHFQQGYENCVKIVQVFSETWAGIFAVGVLWGLDTEPQGVKPFHVESGEQ